MKRFSIFLMCLCMMFNCFVLLTFAHSGKTDANGGHTNYATGEYHYHHGESAHQHPNGKCPYETKNNIINIFIYIVLGGVGLFVLWNLVISPLIHPSEMKSPQNDKTPSLSEASSLPQKESQQHLNISASSAVTKEVPSLTNVNSTKTHYTSVRQPPAPRPFFGSIPSKGTHISQPPVVANGSLSDHPDILGVDRAYLTEKQALAYALSIETPRGKKAVTEQILLDNIETEDGTKPFRVTCSTTSLNSYQQYRTTLVSCTCKDYQTRHLPCKHMIALAININAITVDMEVLQKR